MCNSLQQSNLNMEEQVKLTGNSFQDLPVGKSLGSNNMFSSEFPDNYIPNEMPNEEESQPLDKRLSSKVWKTRQQAYLELLKMFEEGQGLGEYQQHLIKIISDSNVQAQEKGFRILELFVIKKDRISTEVSPLLKTVVEKGLSSGKPQIVRLANQVLVEFFGKGFKDKVVKVLEENISNKNPKTAAACIDSISVLVLNYGVGQMALLKPFMKEIEKLADSTAASIKSSIVNFYKEASRWLGEAVRVSLSKFKKPVQEEVQKFMSSHKPETMIPLRASEAELASGSNAAKGVDAYSFADPVDVIDKFNQSWANQIMTITKWSEKKAALEVAIKEFGTPKIVNRSFHHLIALINRLLTDSNLNIQVCGLQLLRNLSQGLRKGFQQGARNVFKDILLKLREKKSQIVEEVHKVLAALLLCISMDDMAEKVKENLADKAPNMKTQTMTFIMNNFTRKDHKTIKSLLPIIKNLMQDATVAVRDKSFEFLCKVKAVFGLGIFGDLLLDKSIPTQKVQRIKSEKEILSEEPIQETSSTSFNTQRPQKANKAVNPNRPQTKPLEVPTREVGPAPKRQLVPMQVENSSNMSNVAQFNSMPVVNPYLAISDKSESARFQSYNQLLYNPAHVDYFILRQKAFRQSSPEILGIILSLIERSFSQHQITKEALQFLLKHDWSRQHTSLVKSLKNIKVNHKYYDIVKEDPLLLRELDLKDKSKELTTGAFITQLLSLSGKWKNPDTMGSSLKAAFKLVEQCKNIKTDCGNLQNSTQVGEISFNLKSMILQKPSEIAAPFIELAGDLVSMCIITKTKGKIVIPTIISKMADPLLEKEVELFLQKCICTQSSFLFNQLSLMLSNSTSRSSVLSFIQKNIDTFVATSTSNQIKGFTAPILNCLNDNQQTATKAEFILDHISRLHGDNIISTVVKENKLLIPSQYAQKWRVEGILNSIINTKILPKQLRLDTLFQNKVWTQTHPVPSQVQKLLGIIGQLPFPINQLAIPLPIDRNLLLEVFVNDNFVAYSDLLVQWLFWRFHIERVDTVMTLIEVSKKLIHYKLQETEIFTLLSGTFGALKLGKEVLDGVSSFNDIFRHQNIDQSILMFYIDSMRQRIYLVDQILYIIRTSFQHILSSHLLTMAKIPEVKTHKEFNKFLQQQYEYPVLKAYGFVEVFNKKNTTALPAPKAVDTDRQLVQLCVERFKLLQSAEWFLEMHNQLERSQTGNSSQLHTRIIETLSKTLTEGNTPLDKYQTYIASFINTMKSLAFDQVQVMRLIRTTVYVLSDIDSKKPANHKLLVKPVNALLMATIENIDYQLFVKSLIQLLREEVVMGENLLTVQLFIKIISKVTKNSMYKQNVQECYPLLIEQIMTFLDDFYMDTQDSQSIVPKKIRISLVSLYDSNPQQVTRGNVAALQKHKANRFNHIFMEPLLKKSNVNSSMLSPNCQKQELTSAQKRLVVSQCSIAEIQSDNIFTKHQLR